MNGAHSVLQTLVEHGVDTCFMNPGTTEMHFVDALDDVRGMRGVLALFEGVATGAADGYARMAGRPAATLLHLGPGLGNGLANLHNARRARSPIVNIVGDHAVSHRPYDAPLQSDIEAMARTVSGFVRTCESTSALAKETGGAVRAATGPPGAVATLIVPADVAWSEGGVVAEPEPSTSSAGQPDETGISTAAAALRSGEPAAVLIGGRACRGATLETVAAIARTTGARLLAETFPARLERGRGRPAVERLAYLGDFVAMQLDGIRHLVLVDAVRPVSFFAYPGKPGDLVPEWCAVHQLAAPSEDLAAAVEGLASALAVPADAVPRQEAIDPGLPSGPLDAQAICQIVGQLLPDDAIVSDEGNTSSLFAPGATAGAPPHDWLCLAGGAIGQGLPVALGAAVAEPGRRVVALESDGSSLYTLQSWWSMARAGLDVTTVLLNNQSYAVLNMELRGVTDSPGPRALDVLDLERPDIEFTALAKGLGVPAARATTAEEFADGLARSLATPGPSVVEAVLPPLR